MRLFHVDKNSSFSCAALVTTLVGVAWIASCGSKNNGGGLGGDDLTRADGGGDDGGSTGCTGFNCSNTSSGGGSSGGFGGGDSGVVTVPRLDGHARTHQQVSKVRCRRRPRNPSRRAAETARDEVALSLRRHRLSGGPSGAGPSVEPDRDAGWRVRAHVVAQVRLQGLFRRVEPASGHGRRDLVGNSLRAERRKE